MTDRPARLFDGHDALFLALLARAERYGEYGMGQSTLAAAHRGDRAVRAVDTAAAWVTHVEASLSAAARMRTTLLHVDLGPVGNWGFPKSYARRDHFHDYFEAPWSDGFAPDLVLIDGRFRVACFLTSVLRATPGTHILFDDYSERGYYHLVEALVEPQQRTDRQAVFVVPEVLDRTVAEDLLASFAYVMD